MIPDTPDQVRGSGMTIGGESSPGVRDDDGRESSPGFRDDGFWEI